MDIADVADASGLARARSLTLVEILARSARRHGDGVALICGDATATYRDLDARSSRLAAALIERGVAPGDHVAILMRNRIEFLEAFFGVQRAGAIPVPLNVRLAQPEIDYILADCNAVAILTDPSLLAAARSAAASLPALELCVTVGLDTGDPELPDGVIAYEPMLAAAAPAGADRTLGEHDVAVVMYTSGTTGRPKGAMLSHQNLVVQIMNWSHEVGGLDDATVWSADVPLFHIAGIAGVLPFLWIGGRVVIGGGTQFDPGRTIAEILSRQVTHTFLVPSQWALVCAHPEARRLPETLRVAMWGASPATPAILEAMNDVLTGVEVISTFGQTEMCPNTTWLKGSDAVRKLGSVGLPGMNVEVRIVDEDMHDVPEGEIGEIVYRGPTVMLGYLGNPVATAEAFAGGWFHSGDLVRQDADGYIYVVDRKKDMIISGGENVYPAEVEAALRLHAAVADVAVVGVPHEKWLETPVAMVIRRDGADVDAAALLEHCRTHLAGFKRPSAVTFIEELPRNAGGKVLKRQLREEYLARP